jgi:hypothetical protein
LQQRAKPYVNSPLFRDYSQRVFILHHTILRQQKEFAKDEAALLTAHCPSHMKQELLRILKAARVPIVTFASHKTHISQVLDLTLFGPFKNRRQYQLPFETDHRTANFTVKVHHDFRARMIEMNALSVFQ